MLNKKWSLFKKSLSATADITCFIYRMHFWYFRISGTLQDILMKFCTHMHSWWTFKFPCKFLKRIKVQMYHNSLALEKARKEERKLEF